MSLRFRFCELSEIDAAGWHAIAQDRPNLRLEVLRAQVRLGRALRLRAALLEDQAGIAAAALERTPLAAEHPLSLDSLIFGRARPLLGSLGVSMQPALAFGPAPGSEPGWLVRRGRPDEQAQWTDALLTHLEAHARAEERGLSLLQLHGEPALESSLRRRGFVSTVGSRIARLDIEWRDLAGYLRWLGRRSRSAAATVRHEVNRSRRSGLRVERVAHRDLDPAALHALVLDHYRRKNGREPSVDRQFFEEITRTLGEDLIVFESRRGVRRNGILAVIRSGTVGWVAFVGIDRSEPVNDFAYFNLTYYALADAAAGLGLRRLLYGGGVLEAKARRGCEIVAGRTWYRPHRRALRSLARPLLRAHEAWWQRKSA